MINLLISTRAKSQQMCHFLEGEMAQIEVSVNELQREVQYLQGNVVRVESKVKIDNNTFEIPLSHFDKEIECSKREIN